MDLYINLRPIKLFKNLRDRCPLKEEFIEEGFFLTDVNPDVIVLAFDQDLTYKKLTIASYLLQEGKPYVATHLDDRCPTEKGFIPDAGGIASLLFKTTDRMPQVFGKPNISYSQLSTSCSISTPPGLA